MEDSDYKIVVAGESVVGKTALTLQLIQVKVSTVLTRIDIATLSINTSCL